MTKEQEAALRRTFSENIRRLLSAHRMTQLELAKRLSVGPPTVNDWVKGRTTPRSNVLQRLTEVFGCELSDLLSPVAERGDALAPEALRIAQLYSVAEPRDRRLVNTILEPYGEKLSENAPKAVPLPKTKVRRRGDGFIEITVFEDQLPAAGYGSYFDAPKSHVEQYPAELVPERATFGVPVGGDSMEPDYPNHATAFVQSAPRVENGEVGLFSLNGEPYIKQLVVDSVRREVRLHSLNPKYEDIPIHEFDDLRTFGRVVGAYGG